MIIIPEKNKKYPRHFHNYQVFDNYEIYNMQLPIEIQEKILFCLSPKELLVLCHTHPIYRSICLSPLFWKNKFEKNELNFPKHIPATLGDWIIYYHHSLVTRNEVNRLFQSGREFTIPLRDAKDCKLVSEVLENWKCHPKTKGHYNLILFPHEKGYKYIIEKQIRDGERITGCYRLELRKFHIHREKAWSIVYDALFYKIHINPEK